MWPRPQGDHHTLPIQISGHPIDYKQPENILIHSPGPYPHVQIADFGLARPQGYQETLNVCGTVSYLPPEGILALDHKHLGYVGMSADCWSAGVILYIMLSYALLHDGCGGGL